MRPLQHRGLIAFNGVMDASTDSKISNLMLRSSATIGPIGVTVSPVEVFVTWVKTSDEHIMFKGPIPNGKHQLINKIPKC